ncbi:MAG: hypothetical protein E7539_06750 [Ruminococcaceae bacterium]|nr:hypothetical protein [Oscillospiraceae bacterium]
MKKFSFLSKILAAALSVMMVLCTTSCSDTTWVFSAGDDTVSSGVYLGYLVDSYYVAANSVTNMQVDLFSQKIGDVKVADYIKDAALQSSKKHIVINRLFDEYKLSFTDDEAKEFEDNFASIWQNVSSLYEENGCGKNSLRQIMLTDDNKYQKIFEYYYSEDGKDPVSESDRKEYFNKNYAKIKYISVNYSNHFSGVDTASDATDAQKKELEKIANDYLEQLKKGENIDKLINAENSAAEKLNADEDETKTEDEDKDEADEKVNYTFLEKDTSDDPADFNKEIFAAKTGVPTKIANSSYGYYVFIRYETDADGEDYTERAEGVLSSMKSEAFAEIIEKEVKNIKVTQNTAAVKRYKPQNIDFNIG